jgi:protein involved in polysaccharide export with SLBB domain
MAYTKPALRESIKKRILASGKGGKPGQWSARKAQLVAQAYKKAGGGYSGSKTAKQASLSKWTKEDWGTKSGKPSTQGSKATGERYLPRKAREAMSASEYARTSAKKREDLKKGKQFSKQPKSIAKKAARFR